MIHQQQSFGEIRGLERLQNIINERELYLQRKLNLIPKQEPIEFTE